MLNVAVDGHTHNSRTDQHSENRHDDQAVLYDISRVDKGFFVSRRPPVDDTDKKVEKQYK
jgi:hypothetical protein